MDVKQYSLSISPHTALRHLILILLYIGVIDMQ